MRTQPPFSPYRYWDWALYADLPEVVATQQQVTLETPQGVQTIPNPLYSYGFHPMYQDFGEGLSNEAQWEAWLSTYRWPTTTDKNAQSNSTAMESDLDNNKLTLRDRTYNLLTQATTYEAFSEDGYLGPQTDPKWYESLESIHNMIHGMTGSNGHMGVVDFAAFDPVFWLHHCNVSLGAVTLRNGLY